MRLHTLLAAVAAILCSAALGSRAAAAAPSVDQILEAHRAAMALPSTSGTLEALYNYTGQGLTGTVNVLSDIEQGHFIRRHALGIVTGASGYDGDTPWMQDLSGATTPQTGGDRIALAVNEAYRNANLWWRPFHDRAEVEYVGEESVAERPAHHLRVTPRHGKPFEAWFDAGTHLLVQIAEEQMFFRTRTRYEDYARVSGFLVPRRIVFDGGTGPKNVETLTLARLDVSAPLGPSRYGRPAEAPTGARIANGRTSVGLPFRLLNNHIYVEGRINGRGPYTFIVDTGGQLLISPRVAQELGLKAEGAAPSAGVGAKILTSGYARVAEVALKEAVLENQTAVIQEIYDPAVEGLRVDAMVGFELFRRFVVEIDYGAKLMRLFPPGTFSTLAAGTAVPFRFYTHLPQVEGRVDDLPARFDIDTGSRSEVDLSSPFVRGANLLARYPQARRALTGWGVGGPSYTHVARLGRVSLGDVVVTQPVGGLSQAQAGSFSDANMDANVGSGLLKRFIVTFDYGREVMYLKPLDPPPKDAGSFDRAGLWLNATPEGYRVMHVTEGGPAARAGLRRGDVLTTVQGKPARPEALSDMRTLLRSLPPGSSVKLERLRGKRHSSVVLVLQDLF